MKTKKPLKGIERGRERERKRERERRRQREGERDGERERESELKVQFKKLCLLGCVKEQCICTYRVSMCSFIKEVKRLC